MAITHNLFVSSVVETPSFTSLSRCAFGSASQPLEANGGRA
ncbi:hypothetical protein [Porphyrobacter sp. CACIAM 03H1]|nr:hypothetical protein [Porphyrobacter sp. CACIAM 03H1]